ncbi:ABC transporter permease [Dictyobacter formicarum]|uniref:Amino acid ABC transporter permease n=1 Tax=Dictyobacter formicarum TaxID=2778368 RepID=A0ABQ3VR85_9CHLR|nr:ABC transporter permease [Dictyobacter formicarum]GHO88103.1 amino acid ABC transporter permease [Dictyobacter formicarum]
MVSFSNIAIFTLQHLYLSLLGTMIGSLIGFVLAIWIRRRPRLAAALMGLAEVIQTIPSIALLAFLLLAFGLGDTTLVAGLALYAILPVLQNTYEGLEGVDPAYREIGKGMGMTRGEIFRQIEIPLAFPVILAGLRVSLVTAIGIATIGVFVGSGGLGDLIYRGLQTIDTPTMLAGAIPAGLLAIVLEIALSLLERRLSRATATR